MAKLFYQQFGKRTMDIVLFLVSLVIASPLLLAMAILIKLTSPGSIIFKQKRVGKNGKVFEIYKFRTMVSNAEKLKAKYLKLNEASGPVFKIRNDPRFTILGKKLSHTGLDELPQLFNILIGDMSFVGPRPLPVSEEAKITSQWRLKRQAVKPGLACSWLLKGAHKLRFSQWMWWDLRDIKRSSFLYDWSIFFKTVFMGLGLVKDELKRKNHFPFKIRSKTLDVKSAP